MPVTIPPTEQTVILETLDGLPPEYILNELTLDQKKHWSEVKVQYQRIHLSLKAYFSGNPVPLQDLPDEEKELLQLLTDLYISLYAVIQQGWKDILQYFSQRHSEHYSEIFPFNSPGETLAAILERNATAEFWQCKQGRHDFRPRKMYDLRREGKKLAEGLFTDIQHQRHRKEVRTVTRDFESLMELEVLCIHACRLAVKNQKDRTLSRKIQHFEETREDLSKILHRSYRSMKGYAWENGKKLQTTKEGGTYRTSS